TNFDITGFVVALTCMALVVVILGLSAMFRGWKKRTIRKEFQRFFGSDLELLETHDKNFPGYDLASVSRALSSLRADCCAEFKEVGATQAHLNTMRMLLDIIETAHGRRLEPTAPTYQRVPVDVHEETSFPTSGIYLAVLRTDAGGEKIAILLS